MTRKSESIKNEYPDRIVWRNKKGLFHQYDGPAIIHHSGLKEWYCNGKRHRLNGPAREWPSGFKSWWVNGAPLAVY
jgi:hypothetical protein